MLQPEIFFFFTAISFNFSYINISLFQLAFEMIDTCIYQ